MGLINTGRALVYKRGKQKIGKEACSPFHQNKAVLLNGETLDFKELREKKAFLVWVVACS